MEAQLRRAGRALPRNVRQAAKDMVDAERMSQEPKMLRHLDSQRVSAAYDICVVHLDGIDGKALKIKALFGFGATVIVQLAVIGAVFVAVLHWRGYI